MERETKKLKKVVIVSPEESKRVWDKSWELYLKSVGEQGLNDPKRLPTFEMLHRKCTI